MRTVNAERHARKRALILQAAAEEFAAHGVDGTSTAGICRHAGIGSGTLFHYFATKRELFHALFHDDLERNSEVCERALACAQPAAGLDVMVEHLVADLANPLTPGLAAAAMLEANRDVDFASLLVADAERTHRTLTMLLGRMSDDGLRPVWAPDRAARWIQGVVDASYQMAGGDGFDPELQVGELRQVVDWLVGRSPRSVTAFRGTP